MKINRMKYEYLINERNHIENLLNNRFNFFIIFFGSMLGSITLVANMDQLILILLIGTAIEGLLAATIMRAQFKLSLHLTVIRNKFSNSPEAEADKKRKWNCKWSVNDFVGYFIPILVMAILISFIVLFCFNPEIVSEIVFKKTVIKVS